LAAPKAVGVTELARASDILAAVVAVHIDFDLLDFDFDCFIYLFDNVLLTYSLKRTQLRLLSDQEERIMQTLNCFHYPNSSSMLKTY
jgi:hypothetical protein